MATNDGPDPTSADAAAKARAASLVGRVIAGRYRIEELMAMGGMGAVYRGEHLRMRKRIAIKVLHPDTEGLPELVARFEREAVAGAQLSHPNVAIATDFGEIEDGSTFLVLEYVAGQTLHEALKSGPMSPERAVRIAQQLAGALAAVHAAGIVHRDVKPRNVMLVEGTLDQVKLIDFGLAKIAEGSLPVAAHDERGRRAAGPLTGSGIVLGTVAYLAPEAALGMNAVDARSDLYALGIILYQMLAGKHPFEAVDPVQLFKQQRLTPPPPISVRAPGVVVPEALEAIALRLLAKNKLERFASGDEVIAALEAATLEAKPPSPPPSPPSPAASDEAAKAPSNETRSPRHARFAASIAVLAMILALLARSSPRRAPAPAAASVTAAASTPAMPSPSSTERALEAAPSATAVPSASASPMPSEASPSATSPSPERAEIDARIARATLVKAAELKDWQAAGAALLALASAQPSAFHAQPVASAAKEVVAALAREGDGRDDPVFEALAERSGPFGLDVLYDLVESRGRSRAAIRAAATLARPEILARAPPALRVAFELRQAPCDRKLDLLSRAESEGDARALVVLETFGAACFGENHRVEATIKALRARLNRPPAAP